jgi:hypothetical protein
VFGCSIFGFSGIGDLVWHLTIGIEQNRKDVAQPEPPALIPRHCLIVSSPFRGRLGLRRRHRRRHRSVAFLPALSRSVGAAAISWGDAHLGSGAGLPAGWPRGDCGDPSEALRCDAGSRSGDGSDHDRPAVDAIAAVLLRWRPPFGSAAILFGIVAGLLCAVSGFRQPTDVAVALGAGLLGDLLIRHFAAGPARPSAFRSLALAVPVALWSGHFLVTWLSGGIGWPVEYWTGITLLAGLTGLGLSILLVPPTLPAHVARR